MVNEMINDLKMRVWWGREKRMFYSEDSLNHWDFRGVGWQATVWDICTEAQMGKHREALHRFIVNNRNSKLMIGMDATDRAGRDIYEGDIVSYCNRQCILVIRRGDHSFYYDIVHQKNKNTIYDIRMNRTDTQWTVLGNIFQHPNLIKELLK